MMKCLFKSLGMGVYECFKQKTMGLLRVHYWGGGIDVIVWEHIYQKPKGEREILFLDKIGQLINSV